LLALLPHARPVLLKAVRSGYSKNVWKQSPSCRSVVGTLGGSLWLWHLPVLFELLVNNDGGPRAAAGKFPEYRRAVLLVDPGTVIRKREYGFGALSVFTMVAHRCPSGCY
jgi:hypothetical protein